MSRELAKWMRAANIAITSEIVTAREEGIENFLNNKLKKENIIEIVKLFYTGKCNDDFLEVIVEGFYEYDKTFADDKLIELRVLAGAIIYEMIEQKNHDDRWIELVGIYAHIYHFLGHKPIVSDISMKIYEDLHERMLSLRENISFEEKRISLLNKDTNFSVDEEEKHVYDDSVAKKLNSMVKKVNELSMQMNNFRKIVFDHEAIIHEDSQILWWLLTGYSDDANARYSEINSLKAAILLGKDLANRVNVFPGPSSAKAVLTKVLNESFDNEEGIFEEYIDSIDDDIIESMLDDYNSIPKTPILFALKKKMENGKGNWGQAFFREFQLLREKISIVDVAYEMYIECLVLGLECR